MTKHDFDPEGRRLPVKIDEASNGEHFPIPLSEQQQKALAYAQEFVSEAARRVGLGRRAFLKSSCGMAATLMALNTACSSIGGIFNISDEAAYDEAAAEAAIGGDEFIVDMQCHCVDPAGSWAQGEQGTIWADILTNVFGQSARCEGGGFDCYSAQQLAKEVFLDSDTDVAVVSALWGGKGFNPTPPDYALEARTVLETIGGPGRGLIHGGVLPNEEGALEFMEVQAKEHKVNAWKLYPQWGPAQVGFQMDDEKYGIPFLERARELDVKIVCAHRGLPLPFLDYRFSHPSDIARAAKLYPDMTFLCYHSGFEPEVTETTFHRSHRGVDRLITAHRLAGFKPNKGNNYAELGSVWRTYMSRPDELAHVMGKLLKYFGEDRICWGTDSIWYGSPQDQIASFRAFEISQEFQEKHGYPALTKEAKAKILGLNAARIHGLDIAALQRDHKADTVGSLRDDYRADPNPSFATLGPKSRREFMALWRSREGRPG